MSDEGLLHQQDLGCLLFLLVPLVWFATCAYVRHVDNLDRIAEQHERCAEVRR